MEFEPTAKFKLDIKSSDLSTDQMYLYENCLLLSSGIAPESLARRHPGNMSRARRLNTTNRLLRFYVATESRDENILLLVRLSSHPQTL